MPRVDAKVVVSEEVRLMGEVAQYLHTDCSKSHISDSEALSTSDKESMRWSEMGTAQSSYASHSPQYNLCGHALAYIYMFD